MTAINYSADDTALLIADPYNDFMSEGGKLYERTKETAKAVGFYDNMRKLIPAVRAAHIQVFIVPHHRWREGDYKRMEVYESNTNPFKRDPEFRCWNLGWRVPS
jgi:nicotinamidase-related amidase